VARKDLIQLVQIKEEETRIEMNVSELSNEELLNVLKVAQKELQRRDDDQIMHDDAQARIQNWK